MTGLAKGTKLNIKDKKQYCITCGDKFYSKRKAKYCIMCKKI